MRKKNLTSLRPVFLSMGVLMAAFECLAQTADVSKSAVVVSEDGTVHVPAYSVPLSSYMSQQAKRRFVDQIARDRARPTVDNSAPNAIGKIRKSVDDWVRPKVERARASYPVDIEEWILGGVRTHVITPKSGVSTANAARILLNLHGGGFMAGGGLHGIAESIPVAGIGRFKVVTIDYRMAPEHRFPAASEDVTAVYRHLLRSYKSTSIGIYGCSAGGLLTAMVSAWFPRERLPEPGAIALLSAGAFGSWSGDSSFTAMPLMGEQPLTLDVPQNLPPESYLSDANLADPLVSPALSRDVLTKFPPTLLITGTRAFDMSAAVQTQRELTKAGVKADLHLWDGMGHCFFLEEDLPESHEAYDVVAHFFNEHLTK